MAAENNLTVDFAKAQSIDFVEQFGLQVGKLVEMLGVQRQIPLTMGTTLSTYTSSVTLDNTKVPKGDIIPLSQVKRVEGPKIEVDWDKKRKAVAVEDVQKYGFEQAVQMTDDALVKELQKSVRAKLFSQLGTGTGAVTDVGFQATLAQAWAGVQTAFEDDAVMTVAFANPKDLANYLGKAQVTIQTAFGLQYIQNFMGVGLVILSSLVPAGKLYATAAQNLVLAYVTTNSGEISKAFDFTTDQTGLIGVAHDINLQRLTAETITLSGLILYAERLDGVIVGTIKAAATA